MERRKLQQVGGGTYTVSVPKEWAEARSLSAGSTVHLYPRADGSLVVRAEETDGGCLTETRVPAGSDDPAVVRAELSGAHAAGFEAVTFEADGAFSDERRRAIEAATRGLVGMELTEEDETEITVRNLLDASEFSARQSVDQLQFVALSALRRATRALIEADAEAAHELRERAADAARLRDVIARRFDRSLSSLEELERLGCSRTELFDYHATARELGRIADRSAEVGRIGASRSGDVPESVAGEFRDLSESVPSIAEDAATAALEADPDAARDVLDRRDRIQETIGAVDRRLADGDAAGNRGDDGTALLRALDSLGRIVEAVAAIAAVAIRSASRPEPP